MVITAVIYQPIKFLFIHIDQLLVCMSKTRQDIIR